MFRVSFQEKYKNLLNAFSLVELMISLVVISVVTAAFSPVIIKKFSASTIDIPKENASQEENSSDLCPLGQYMSTDNSCINCSDVFLNCAICTKDACLTCKSGYISNGVSCTACPQNTIEVIAGGKRLCVTQYNMGDRPEFPVNVSGVTVVKSGVGCFTGICCWQGQTADFDHGYDCDKAPWDYRGCNRTVCNYYAAEKICNNFKYGGLNWRLPALNELKDFYSGYSRLNGSNGLMLCGVCGIADWNIYYTYHACCGEWVPTGDDSRKCKGSNDSCDAQSVWSGEKSNGNAYNYELHEDEWEKRGGLSWTGRSVRCVAEL